MYLVGQEKNKDLIDNGKIDNSTFILIRGPEHYGKPYLVKYIANHYAMHYKLLDNKVYQGDCAMQPGKLPKYKLYPSFHCL